MEPTNYFQWDTAHYSKVRQPLRAEAARTPEGPRQCPHRSRANLQIAAESPLLFNGPERRTEWTKTRYWENVAQILMRAYKEILPDSQFTPDYTKAVYSRRSPLWSVDSAATRGGRESLASMAAAVDGSLAPKTPDPG